MLSCGTYTRGKDVPQIHCLVYVYLVFYCLCECIVFGESTREPPGCYFPDFLQSSGRGMGDWTWKYDGDVHLGKVTGGVYTICSNQYSRYTGDKAESYQESQMRRKCVRQYGPDLFAVKHEEPRPTYQCIKFIQRSPAVIQLAVSDRQVNPEGICSRDKRLCRHGLLAEKQAPVRVESDCVDKEGFAMQFREKNCIPEKSFFSKNQKLVCMATWQVDGDGFALLRKEHERSFYCIRVVFDNLENGCYPRFICMYYDMPATNILRYRLSNVQQWPLELSDQSMCSRETFLVSPDFNDPKDEYEE
ncbi:unnamed protein product, partial [Candidula unifasciata]